MKYLLLVLVLVPSLALAIETLKPYNLTATAAFLVADTNVDGIIDRNEVDRTFRDYDANHNGRISRLEYTSYIQTHSPNLYQVAHALYDIYDVDNDDQLDHHDFDNFYALMDGDGNGQVSHFEYVRYWTILLETLEHQLANGRVLLPLPVPSQHQ